MAREGRWCPCFATLLLVGPWAAPVLAQDAGTSARDHTRATAPEASASTSAAGSTSTGEPTAEAAEPTAEEPNPAAEEPNPAAEEPNPAAEEPNPAAEEPNPAAQEPSEPAAPGGEPETAAARGSAPERQPGKRRFERLHAVMRHTADRPRDEGSAPGSRSLLGVDSAPTRARTLGNVTILSNRPASDATKSRPSAASPATVNSAPGSPAQPGAVRVERHVEASRLTSSLTAARPERPSSSWNGWLWALVALATGLLLPIGVLLSRSTRSRR